MGADEEFGPARCEILGEVIHIHIDQHRPVMNRPVLCVLKS